MTHTEIILHNATHYNSPLSIRRILRNYNRYKALAETGNMVAADIIVDIDMALRRIQQYHMMRAKNYNCAIMATVMQYTMHEIAQLYHCSRQTPCNAAHILCTLISNILSGKMDYTPYAAAKINNRARRQAAAA